MATLHLEQLYLNGDPTKPTIHAAVDARGRWFHYDGRDDTIAIGKLYEREPATIEGTIALVERCRVHSGVASIGWYSWGTDVIEIASADLQHVDKVCAIFKAAGYPITLNLY